MKKPLHLNVRLLFVLLASLGFAPPVSAQGTALPAEINKSFTPISIPSGGISRLDITIFNPNPFRLTSASWTDNLAGVQPGIVIASPANLTNTCGGSVTVVSGTILTLTGGIVPAQVGINPGECTVSINVTSTTQGNLINTIPAGGLTATGGGFSITNTTPASATLRVGPSGAPTISKSFSPSTVWAGQVSQLTIVITNNSSNLLTQATLIDTLPPNVQLANPVFPSLTGCQASGVPASLTAIPGGGSVTLNNGSIAANSTCTIRVNVVSNIQGSYTNTIPAGQLQTAEQLTNASPASAVLNVQAIGVIKSFSPRTIPAGGTTTLTITLQNPTGSPYTGVNVSDTLPGTVLTVVAGSATTTCGGTVTTTAPRTVTLTGGTIPAGSPTAPGICTISVQVAAPAGASSATYRNVIPVGALTTAQGVTNLRPATANVTIAGTTIIGIKSFSPSTINPGENSRLRIDIIAPGDTDLTNFSITDNLPANLKISNSTPASMSGCGSGARLTANTNDTVITLTNGTIPKGTRCRIEIYVTGIMPGVYTNTIPPSNITNDQNRVPANSLTSTLIVSGTTSLSIEIVKGFNPVQVFGGSASTLTIQLINPNATPLTSIAFTDDMTLLGGGMILANPPNLNVGTCGGTLTGSPGDTSFSFSGGSLAANTSCFLTLSVTMNVNGNRTNLIPAQAVTTAQGATNPQETQASLTNLPGVSVSKAFSPNPVARGSYSRLTITIRNTSNVLVTGMGLVDNLAPSGLTIAGGTAPAPVSTCNGQLTAAAGTRTIELTNGVLNGNALCTIAVSVIGNAAGSFRNTIPAGSLRNVQGVTNTQSAQDTLVVFEPSVQLPPEDEDSGPGGRNNRTTNVNIQSGAAGLIPITGFAPDTVTVLESPRPAYAATDLMMEIPALKLNVPIVGVSLQDGSWDVSWLWNQAGWLNKTAYPTFPGNSVVTAHNVTSDGKAGPFARIKYLNAGDYIFVYFGDYRYIYEVVSTSYVKPDDLSVFRHEDKPWLTLVTCDEYDVKTGTYLKRVIVRSKLIDIDLK